MEFSKNELAAILGAASKDASRYNLNTLHLTPDRIEATDGHRAYRLEFVAAHDAGGIFPASIEAAGVAGIVGRMKARETATLDVGATNANGSACFAIGSIPVEAQKVESTYPDTDQVFPKAGDGQTVYLSARYLRDVADAALKVGGKDASLAVTLPEGEHSPVRFDGRETPTGRRFVAVVMPQRQKASEFGL